MSDPEPPQPPQPPAGADRTHLDTGILWRVVISGTLLIALYAWAIDFVTFEGERTIYTVECAGGTWSGNRCSGRLVVGDRFRFRALKAHREVLFWTAGSSEPAGKFTDCEISGGRNWSCPANADAGRTVTLQMVHGLPVADASHRTRTLHSVPKLEWLFLRVGVGWGSTANE
jgi:hypothetical protein